MKYIYKGDIHNLNPRYTVTAKNSKKHKHKNTKRRKDQIE